MSAKKHPLVSIIMPTFNRAYMIKSAIDSVRSQTYQNWELIVVDDGSTDNTAALIHDIGDKRIVYRYQANAGHPAARNCGLSIAQGAWIAYLDSDNELLPNYLKVMLAWLAKNPKRMFAVPRSHRTLELYENDKLVKFIDDSADTPPGLGVRDVIMRNFHVDGNGLMHAKQLFDEGIRWDNKLRMMVDWELALAMAEQYPEGFLYVEEFLVNYHQRFGGDGIVSNSTYGDVAQEFEYIYQKHKNDRLMAEQSWYPQKAQKWQRLQREFESGKQPPYHLYYFKPRISVSDRAENGR